MWRRTDASGVLLRIVVATAMATIYYGVWMTHSNGFTPGKRLVGIRVARLDGKRITFGRVFWREGILKIALLDTAGLIAGGAGALAGLLAMVDMFWSVGNPARRALHDLASGTRVVLAQARELPGRPGWRDARASGSG